MKTAVVMTAVLAVIPTFVVGPGTAHAQEYMRGIDVSHHQGEIDWNEVANSGHVFAFHKATEGATFIDDQYAGNRAEASAASVPFGAYHFARPNGETIEAAEADAEGEAEHFLEVAEPASGDLLPVLDLEATGGLPSDRLIAWTQVWVDAVAEAIDARPLIYTSPNFWKTSLADTTTFADQGFPLWLAHYTSASSPSTPASNWGGHGWAFWQWTNCATIPGISGCVDGDKFAGSDLTPYTVPGAPEPEPTPDDATPPANESPPEISGETEVGRTLNATSGSWSGSEPLAYSYAWHRCDADGSSCSPVLNGTEPTYRLVPADYQHTMKVTVTATNSAGSSSSESSPSGVVTDSTDPEEPRMIKPRREQTLDTRLTIEWEASESQAHYAVRYLPTVRGGRFRDYKRLVDDTTRTRTTLRAETGATYCFSARATDQAGNRSPWSDPRCTTVPFDDRDLRRSSSWRTTSNRSAFLRTLTTTTERGASLDARNVSVREAHVVAQTCRRCGRIAVMLRGRRIGTVDLRSRRTRTAVIRIKRFTSIREGDVSLVVVSDDAPVRIDGLALTVE
ncbi:MAG TPA: glycoside hydrolase family 25 protein [Actinomycetota bacterium]|nr:glycoside hydrolase family 25 protein [Actinomycetota bacterium]